MTQHIDTKKLKLIAEITAMKTEEELNDLETYLKHYRLLKKHGKVFTPIRKSITVEEMKRKQNYQAIDRKEFDKLVAELNIKEPIEELLAMLD